MILGCVAICRTTAIPFSWLIIWICLCTSILCTAQELKYDIQHFSVEEGLSDKLIFSFLEHSSGFVYVGTERGLDRFDGYHFHNIPLSGGLHSPNGPYGPEIGKLHELGDGKILIAYSDTWTEILDSIDILDPVTHTLETFGTKMVDSSFLTIAFDDQLIQLGTSGKVPSSVYGYYGDEFENEIILEKADEQIFAYLKLSGGEMLDLTEERNSFMPHPRFAGKNFAKLIYVLTHNGLILISMDNSPFDTYLNETIEEWQYSLRCRSIAQLGDDQMLLSTEQKNLSLLDLNSGKVAELDFKDTARLNAVSTRNMRSLMVFNDSIVWSTSIHDPLLQLNLNTKIAKPYLRSYFARIYTAILTKDKKIVLVGEKINEENTRILCFDPSGSEIIELDSNRARIPSNEEHNFLLEGRNGDIWYGSSNGLYLIDSKLQKILKAFCGKKDLQQHLDSEYPVHRTLSSSAILAIYEAHDGNLWLGLNGAGVNKLDPETGIVEVINTDHGLPNNTVCGILPDDAGFWFSTYSGLAHYNVRSKEFRNFYKENGLTHDEFNRFSFYRDNRGWNWFGTMNGFNCFNPKDIFSDEAEIRLMLSEVNHFTKDGKTQLGQSLGFGHDPVFTIPSNNRNCTFKVALSDFSNPEANTFYYKLEEIHPFFEPEGSDWRIHGSEREISFEYLPAGKYNLKIRGTTALGATSNELKIKLIVKEYFYKTWWFVGLCILGILGFTYGMHRYRLAQALRLERLRTQLSSDLHDDVGSLLSGVAYQMELLEYSAGEKNKPLVRQIAESSRRAMSRMRDVVWAIDPRKSTILDLIERMRDFAEEMLSPLDITFQIDWNDLPDKKTIPAEYRHDLLMIYKEFLTNTIKHANANRVDIHLLRDGRYFELYLKDNGAGVKADYEKSSGQGLNNIKMRANKMNASLQLIDEEGFGIRLRIPIF